MQWTKGVVSLNFLKTSLTAFPSFMIDAEKSCGCLDKAKTFWPHRLPTPALSGSGHKGLSQPVICQAPPSYLYLKQEARGKVKSRA